MASFNGVFAITETQLVLVLHVRLVKIRDSKENLVFFLLLSYSQTLVLVSTTDVLSSQKNSDEL